MVQYPCPFCGAACRSIARYCGQCGNALETALPSGSVDALLDGETSEAIDRAVILPPAQESMSDGTFLGERYQIVRLLDKGGFGDTYLAHDSMFNRRPCVVKQLRLRPHWDENERRRQVVAFDREAQLIAKLNDPGHSCIPDIYDYLADQRCLVMKYISGRSLASQLHSEKPLSVTIALSYIRDVCAALAYLHRRMPEPVLHRDVKPANILVDTEGRVWLIDFGLAYSMPVTGAAPGDHIDAGTPPYTPPEQWQGQAEPRSDVYALAMTLYALLIGRPPPLRGLLPNVSPTILVGTIVGRAPELPPHFIALLTRTLALVPDDRPTSAELLEALDILIDARSLPAPAIQELLPDPGELVGREHTVATIAAQLVASHLAFIIGPAGIGKSALAASVAKAWADPAKTFWHPFRANDSAYDLLWELAGFLARLNAVGPWRLLHSARGGNAPASKVVLDYIVQTLRGLDCLFVLDDLHVIEQEEEFTWLIERLTAAAKAGEIHLLITSRWQPLTLAPELTTDLIGLTPAACKTLLSQGQLVIDETTAAQLHLRTEGNPQLLLLAAEALRLARAPKQLLENLTEAEPIETYLLKLVKGQLKPDEHQVMNALAVLQGYSASRSALQALLEDIQLRPILSDLSRRRLLIVSGEGSERVYRQHAMLQTFFYDQIPQRMRQVLHAQASIYYELEVGEWLLAARQAILADDKNRGAGLIASHAKALIGRGQARSLLSLIGELDIDKLDDELRIALHLAAGDAATPLHETEVARQAYTIAYATLEVVPTHAHQKAKEQVHICLGMGELLEHEAPEEALAWLKRGLNHSQVNDAIHTARLQIGVGTVLLATGDWDSAEQALIQALEFLPDTEAEWQARALIGLSAVAGNRGDLIRVRKLAGAAQNLHRRSGNILGMMGALQNLALARDEEGDWPSAANEYRQALDLAEQAGSVIHQVELLLNLGVLSIQQGDFDAAEVLLNRSLSLTRKHNLGVQLVFVQASKGDLLLRSRRWAEAQTALVEAWYLARKLNVSGQLAEIHRALALLRLKTGKLSEAWHHSTYALTVARDQEDKIGEGIIMRVRGQVLMASGERDNALAAFTASFEQLEGLYERARTLAVWGEALLPVDLNAGQEKLTEAWTTFVKLGAENECAELENLLNAFISYHDPN